MTWRVFESHQWKESRRLLGDDNEFKMQKSGPWFTDRCGWCINYNEIYDVIWSSMLSCSLLFLHDRNLFILLKHQSAKKPVFELKDSWVWMGFGSFVEIRWISIIQLPSWSRNQNNTQLPGGSWIVREAMSSVSYNLSVYKEDHSLKFPQMMKPDFSDQRSLQFHEFLCFLI